MSVSGRHEDLGIQADWERQLLDSVPANRGGIRPRPCGWDKRDEPPTYLSLALMSTRSRILGSPSTTTP